MNQFDALSGVFNTTISQYNSTLQGYANNADTNTEAIS